MLNLLRCDTLPCFPCRYVDMTDSTENTEPPKATKSRNSSSSVQIQIQGKFQFECVLRDTEESEFLDLVDLEDIVFAVETLICCCAFRYVDMLLCIWSVGMLT